MQITLAVTILRLGRRYVATSDIAGFRVRGAPSSNPVAAFRGLLWTLSGNGPPNDDADLGVHLLLEGTDLTKEMERQALPPSNSQKDDSEAAAWMRAHSDRTYQDYLTELEKNLWSEAMKEDEGRD